jgi:hypothetical protein
MQLNQPVEYVPLGFLYTNAGWIPVNRVAERFSSYNQPSGFLIESISRISFQRVPFHYRAERRGNDTLEVLGRSTGENLFVGRRFVCPTKDTIATFLLGDTTVAVLTSKTDAPSNIQVAFSSSLLLFSGSSQTTLAEIFDERSARFTPTLHYRGEEHLRRMDELYDGESFDWAQLIRWEQFGRSLVVDLGKGTRVRISWDGTGRDVTYSELKIR